LEHGISEEVKAALMVDMDKPELCPHGNPLPGNEKLVEGWIPLTDTHSGDSLIIRRIHELAEEMPGLLDFLESNNISTGVHAEVVDILPINQTVELKVKDKMVTLGFSIAQKIFAETIDKPKNIV
jgi:DtxR family Mn-dependent transcriptional regulator